jgi:hypothetical protein
MISGKKRRRQVLDEDEARGVHPYGNRKSPQTIESKGFDERPLRERVRKLLEIKGLNNRNGREGETERDLRIKSGLELGTSRLPDRAGGGSVNTSGLSVNKHEEA